MTFLLDVNVLIALIDPTHTGHGKLLTHKHLTDTYLLALGMAHGGKLATLDHRLSTGAVHSGESGLHVL